MKGPKPLAKSPLPGPGDRPSPGPGPHPAAGSAGWATAITPLHLPAQRKAHADADRGHSGPGGVWGLPGAPAPRCWHFWALHSIPPLAPAPESGCPGHRSFSESRTLAERGPQPNCPIEVTRLFLHVRFHVNFSIS